MSSITAVVPVRAGSRRVKNKNIRPFMGSTLLEIKIDQLKEITEIDDIIVTTDSPEMLKIAEKKGVTGKRRPIEYCDEKSRTFNEVVRYVAENEAVTDVVMWAPCVCPLVGSDRIREAIIKYKNVVEEQKIFDSVVSAVLIKEYLFDGKKPVNFSAEHHVPSQYLPNWYRIINGFYIAPRKLMIERSYLYGVNPFLFEIDKSEAVDIDDEFDFSIAEFLLSKKLKNFAEG